MNQKIPKGRIGRLVSAGGVVYKRNKRNIGIALCGRREPATWSLPKGTPEEGETILQTAMRETQEETGLEVAAQQPIGSIHYSFVNPSNKTRYNKTVHFFLMLAKGGHTEDHDPEFDDVEWFDADEALTRLTFLNEAKILDKALALIRQGADNS